MSEEPTQPAEDTSPSTPSPSSEAPPSPALDVEEIKAQAAAEAKAIVEAKEAEHKKAIKSLESDLTKQVTDTIVQRIKGEEPESEDVKLARRMLTDSVGYSADVVQLAKEEVKRDLAAEKAEAAADAEAIKPFNEQYPELISKHLNVVEALTMRNLNNNMERSDAIKSACEEAITQFGLKSVDEQRQEGTFQETAFPSGNPGPRLIDGERYDRDEDAASFIENFRKMRSAHTDPK